MRTSGRGALVPPVRAEIERLGGAIDRERTGKHFVLYWSLGAGKFVTVIPTTSANSHALGNVIARIRRCAREAAPA